MLTEAAVLNRLTSEFLDPANDQNKLKENLKNSVFKTFDKIEVIENDPSNNDVRHQALITKQIAVNKYISDTNECIEAELDNLDNFRAVWESLSAEEKTKVVPEFGAALAKVFEKFDAWREQNEINRQEWEGLLSAGKASLYDFDKAQTELIKKYAEYQAAINALKLVINGQPAAKGSEADDRTAETNKQPELHLVDKQPEPQLVDKQPEPQLVDKQPEPQLVDKQPEPQLVDKQPEPQLVDKQPEPQLVDKQPEPQLADKQPEPQLADKQPEPKLADKQPETKYAGVDWLRDSKKSTVEMLEPVHKQADVEAEPEQVVGTLDQLKQAIELLGKDQPVSRGIPKAVRRDNADLQKSLEDDENSDAGSSEFSEMNGPVEMGMYVKPNKTRWFPSFGRKNG
ncbi:Periplasmic protein TonB [Stappia aggregata IAM 12614]|uniref:Periplasmic protein TonB n=1 Tax=Roseibium aggregatum (strain ATCC 25650 / DSM 13394 / JCM 20685 / NBRC 16684 / NCIMB 2208 / IAM 12614 / B1) TaxID=384765 RepID=A0P2K7_ROSAI|nr:hypothetical protein [Roseibium aggregatum]EAV40660.1 Periplasmic protein TonB [Stappia aggregata IAM 12614] [Roseibium aggregatum IAM 12614]